MNRYRYPSEWKFTVYIYAILGYTSETTRTFRFSLVTDGRVNEMSFISPPQSDLIFSCVLYIYKYVLTLYTSFKY